MTLTRRDFVATSVFGAAGLYATSGLAGELLEAQGALAAEDGYRLWLRYAPPNAAAAGRYRESIRQITVEGFTPTSQIVRNEVGNAIASMLGAAVPTGQTGLTERSLVIGTPQNSAAIRGLGWDAELTRLGAEGYIIRPATIGGHNVLVVASAGEIGALYGAFHFLRLVQTGQSITTRNIVEKPKVMLRMINHWDNLNGTIERGYAGPSLWKWEELPGTIDPRYADYARAMASIDFPL